MWSANFVAIVGAASCKVVEVTGGAGRDKRESAATWSASRYRILRWWLVGLFSCTSTKMIVDSQTFVLWLELFIM